MWVSRTYDIMILLLNAWLYLIYLGVNIRKHLKVRQDLKFFSQRKGPPTPSPVPRGYPLQRIGFGSAFRNSVKAKFPKYFISHMPLKQYCGAEMIYFGLRLQLHLCPLFRLQLLPYMATLKLYYTVTVVPSKICLNEGFFFILASSKSKLISVDFF